MVAGIHTWHMNTKIRDYTAASNGCADRQTHKIPGKKKVTEVLTALTRLLQYVGVASHGLWSAVLHDVGSKILSVR